MRKRGVHRGSCALQVHAVTPGPQRSSGCTRQKASSSQGASQEEEARSVTYPLLASRLSLLAAYSAYFSRYLRSSSGSCRATYTAPCPKPTTVEFGLSVALPTNCPFDQMS